MKERKIGVLFLILIVLQLFVIYYQNVLLPRKDSSSYKIGYIVSEDISKGEEINQDKVKAVKIRDDSFLNTYVENLDEVVGMVAKTDIYKNEMLSTTRLTDKKAEKEGKSKFELYIDVNQNLTNVKEDDNIRVFVRLYDDKTNKTEVLNLLEDKKIEKVYYKEGKASGNATEANQEVAGILVLASDEELLNYHSANKLGEIIVAKYNDKEEPNVDVIKSFSYKDYVEKGVEINE